MWTKLTHIVLKNRVGLMVILAVITVFMAYKGKDMEWSYELAKTVPSNDPDMIQFMEFKEQFGEDGNLVAIGISDSAVYTTENFYRLSLLSDELSKLRGVNEVLSLPRLYRLEKNTQKKKFELKKIFEEIPENQEDLDALLKLARDQMFYSGQIFNPDNGASLILITLSKEVLNSVKRQQVTKDILFLGEEFSKSTGIELKYAGLPFVRSVIMGRIKNEMLWFLFFSVVVTGMIMLFFFKSWDAVVFPMIIIAVVIIWTMGIIAIFGYKITILTGLLPPIIVVIGIPNSVYLLNKYHQEIEKYGKKIRALSVVVRKIGVVALITNLTTAIGFGVLTISKITVLREFGIVASLSIMATFVVSIILIPSVFSLLPTPHGKQLKHLKFKFIDKFLTGIDLLVHRYKYTIFVVVAVIVALSITGLYRIHSVSYMVDDIPEDSKIKQDLVFFEENFSGIMPLEVVVNTGSKRGALRRDNLVKIDQLENFLAEQENVSRPVSILSFIKAARQAFYNNNPDYYDLPSKSDQGFILRYLRNQTDASGLLGAFVDTTGQVMRISLKIADIGSNKMDDLIENIIKPKIAEIFNESKIVAFPTGTTLLFVKGNKFLIENLRLSLILAFIIIAGIMSLLFGKFRIIIISLIPNIIPLMITAGIMGFAGIPFKPSTAITFSISFGISVDYSIHFLAKYRQELFANNFFVPLAVSKSIREIGASMVYTSIVLFAGFVIFIGSDFGGTIALGKLTSITLLIAMFTNMIVLPAMLLAFDDGKRRTGKHKLIDDFEDYYDESEDEEINIKLIEVEENNGVDTEELKVNNLNINR
ncbi:RND family transporter [Bacteroidota bacterium]